MKRLAFVLLLILALPMAATAESPKLIIVNQANDPATVRVIGPTAGYIEVPASASRAISISGGEYRLKIRYCAIHNRCHYSMTDIFYVTETTNTVSQVTVTLHSSGGNLNERAISESDFNN